ncbi:MAG: SGNH/GDSL hydrolase family protein [Aquincola tertiaricarbonis]
MPQLTSPLSTPAGMAGVNPAHVGKMAGTRLHFPSLAAWTAAITSGATGFASDLWADGQEMTISDEADTGAVRVWRSSLAHARTIRVGGTSIVLAANTNLTLATSGVPASGTGNTGDVAIDSGAGVYYTKGAGGWGAASSLYPVSAAVTLKILATRTGQNGAGGTFGQYASNTLIKHVLPYGAKSLIPVMSGTKASSDEAAIAPGLYCVDNIAINAGGTGHAVGDIITGPSAGTTMVPFTVEVLAVSAGAITDIALIQPGAYLKANLASAAAAQSATTGAGTGATFAVRWKQAAYVSNYGLMAGIPASALVTVAGNAVTSVAVVNGGSGYTSAPAVTFSGGGGGGAAATAVLGTGVNADKVVAINVTNGGSGYVGVPTASIAEPVSPQAVYAGFDARGARNVNLVVPAGGVAAYDPIAVDLPAGQKIMSRSWTGGTAMSAGRRISGGEQSNSTAGGTNLAQSGSGSFLADGTFGLAAQPLALVGRPAVAGGTSLVILSDSIGHGIVGAASARDTMDADANSGWIERGLASRVPFISYSCPGDAAYRWTVNGSERRFAELEYLRRMGVVFDAALVAFAVNDMTQSFTYAQFKANMVLIATRLRALGFRKIGTVTGTPYTTSSDSWATTANQTQNGTVTPKVTAFNADIDAGGFAGVFDFVWDIRPYVQASAGIWLPNVTTDGVHPAQATHIAMSAAVRVSDLA